MKRFAGLVALTLAVPGFAHAANISGAYSIKFTTLCQSIENEVFKPSTQIQTIQEGKIGQTVGVITFTPTKAGGTSGKISASFTQTNGTLAILGLPGPPASPDKPDMTIKSAAQTGTYTLAPPSGTAPGKLTLTFTGQSPEIFTIYLSNLTGAVYARGDFIGTDGNKGALPSCSNSGTIELN
jgi:hypothetical protein